jgi:hypothetical protein
LHTELFLPAKLGEEVRQIAESELSPARKTGANPATFLALGKAKTDRTTKGGLFGKGLASMARMKRQYLKGVMKKVMTAVGFYVSLCAPESQRPGARMTNCTLN